MKLLERHSFNCIFLSLNCPLSAYWFGQATLVHVLIAYASLPASTGVVHGPGGTGHSVTVVAGTGRVVGAVSMVMMMVMAVGERGRKKIQLSQYTHTYYLFIFPALLQRTLHRQADIR